MPLKLTLKPNEKILIGTAVITNAGPKSELIVQNTVPVLRERDIITEDKADTGEEDLLRDLGDVRRSKE